MKLQEYWNVGVTGKWVGRLPCSSNWLISEFVDKGFWEEKRQEPAADSRQQTADSKYVLRIKGG